MFNAKSLLDALVSAGSQAARNNTQAGQPGGQQGGLGGLLGGLADQVQRSGGLGNLAGQILTQARQGVGDAARQAGGQPAATPGAGGSGADQLLAQARTIFTNNPQLASVALGSLGALVFGSKSGRSVAMSAAKLGGIALIGGLAYKAYQSYQAGKPLLDANQQPILPAPAGTGFEPQAASDSTALTFIRAMIAAAAADGQIDATERNTILAGLKEAGLDAEAHQWLAAEMAQPASIDALVEAAASPELATQIYAAARLAIDPDTPAEKDFLAGLAGALGLDVELVANIDAAAGAAKA
ncbi:MULTISPECIES: DUF533 domain-containing protein [unclassified Bosea (in: a-proteobacteria)]|uniref:tellurite resistance TerB family protein n=1 Tax=unclassified Bosea (in: a-proteobacteria) TaxID=2653178 RepID=UPI000953DE68|nr:MULTISPECIES: DUF533 domain-containing protein [unclassified Bosea (in: a-proteobacteria)]TAJ29694.1 MAG: DUF533 domain-containing protein [Bosea sp. (in: a-proteobacteria)]SIQ57601.1 Uncharacterized membrane protein YebE, DUF533 family [Bosea sp. TND4EK4]